MRPRRYDAPSGPSHPRPMAERGWSAVPAGPARPAPAGAPGGQLEGSYLRAVDEAAHGQSRSMRERWRRMRSLGQQLVGSAPFFIVMAFIGSRWAAMDARRDNNLGPFQPYEHEPSLTETLMGVGIWVAIGTLVLGVVLLAVGTWKLARTAR